VVFGFVRGFWEFCRGVGLVFLRGVYEASNMGRGEGKESGGREVYWGRVRLKEIISA